MATAKTKTKAVTQEDAPMKRIQSGVISEWGPFAVNTYVTTPHGDYGLMPGHVLTFDMVEKLNKNTLEMETVAVPNRRRATQAEIDASGIDLSAMQPGPAFFAARDKKNAPQLLEITVNGGVDGETFPGIIKQAPVQEDH